MSRYSSSSAAPGCKVYVGGLTQYASKDEVEMAFERYGRLRSVFVARNPPGFAFIEYEHPQDAEDAVRALDGRLVCGVRARVEISHGKSRVKDMGGDRRGGGDSYRSGGGERRGADSYRGGDRRVSRDRSREKSRERRPRSR